MLACGTGSGLLFLTIPLAIVAVFVPVLNLGALTAVAMRPGRDVPAVRRIGWWAVGVGALTTMLVPLVGPMALVGLAEIAAGLATVRLNAHV